MLGRLLEVIDHQIDDGLHLLFRIARVMPQVCVLESTEQKSAAMNFFAYSPRTYPFRSFEHRPCQVETRRGDVRRRIRQEAVVYESNLHEVLGKGTCLDVVVVGLGATAQKVERIGVVESKVQDLEDITFRLEDFLVRVSTVGHVDEVLDRRSHDFFVLGSDEHGRQADELELLERDDPEREEAINDVDGKEKRLGKEAELVVDLDEPVNENAAHLPLQVLLVVHVVRVGHGLLLKCNGSRS